MSLWCFYLCQDMYESFDGKKKITGQFSRITFALKFKRKWFNLNSLFIYISAISKDIHKIRGKKKLSDLVKNSGS